MLKNGEIANANDINSIVLKKALLDSAYFEKSVDSASSTFSPSVNNTNTQYNDYIYDGFIYGSGKEDTTNTTALVDNEIALLPRTESGNKTFKILRRVFNCKVFDSFDTSLDTTKWTTSGTVTQSGGALRVANGGVALSNGASGLDLKALPGNSEFIFSSAIYDGSIGFGGYIQISNGSTHVTVHSDSQGGSGNPPYYFYKTVRVKIDKANQLAYTKVGDDAWGSAIDISSVTTNWYIRITNSEADTVALYFLGYIDGTAGTVDYVTTAQTFNETKDTAILTWDYEGDDTEITGYVSANGGSNYTECDKDTWTTITNPGTSGKIKLTLAHTTTILTGEVNINGVRAIGAYLGN